MKRITVLLAEDHMVVREGLRSLLLAEGDIEIIGEAQNGRQAVELTKKLHPHVVVMDIAMPLLNGLEAIRQIRKALPSVRVLILSAHNEEAYIERVIMLGASGYLIKQTSLQILAKAIRVIHKGGTCFTPLNSSGLTRNSDSKPPRYGKLPSKKSIPLSSREMEVLQLIAEGKANKQTAHELGISIKTVEKHRQNLMLKLKIHDTASLTRYAISTGIIETSVQLSIV